MTSQYRDSFLKAYGAVSHLSSRGTVMSPVDRTAAARHEVEKDPLSPWSQFTRFEMRLKQIQMLLKYMFMLFTNMYWKNGQIEFICNIPVTCLNLFHGSSIILSV